MTFDLFSTGACSRSLWRDVSEHGHQIHDEVPDDGRAGVSIQPRGEIQRGRQEDCFRAV